MTRTCLDCPKPISRDSKGRCRRCAIRAVCADPELIARRNEKTRQTRLDPVVHARHAEACRAGKRRQLADPAEREKLRQAGHRTGKKNFWRHGDPEMQSGAREAIRRALLAWCPEAYWPLNADLKRRHFTLPERQRIVGEQRTRDEQDRLAAMTPFERQLERVRNGAQLIEVRPMRSADPAFTLGGVSSGML